MKKIISIFIVIMSIITTSTLSACKRDNPETLKIKMLAAGYGSEWATKISKKFTEKTGIDVKIESTEAYYNTTFEAELLTGEEADLYFSSAYNGRNLLAQGNNLTGSKDKKAMADLTDVMNSTVEGEGVMLKEKLRPDIEGFVNLAPETQSGSYYFLPWLNGPNGLVYNKTVFADNGWTVPRTTNELISLTQKIKDAQVKHAETKANITPYVWAPTGYWQYIYYVWQAQYDGYKSYNDFWQGIDAEGKFSENAFLYPGRLEAMKVLSSIVDPTYSFTGSTSMDFTVAQIKLLEGEATMMPNGEWIESEMKKNFLPGEVDLGIMKTPVISSLGLKTGITEDVLLKIIDTIDSPIIPEAEKVPGQHNIPSTMINAQLQLIKDSRRMVFSSFSDSIMVAQATSPRLESAKKFIKYMATDEAISIFANSTLAGFTAYQYDVYGNSSIMDKATTFQKDKFELMKNPILIYTDTTNPMFYRNALTGFNQYKQPEVKLGAVSVQERKTAQALITDEFNYVKSRWSDYLKNAGL